MHARERLHRSLHGHIFRETAGAWWYWWGNFNCGPDLTKQFSAMATFPTWTDAYQTFATNLKSPVLPTIVFFSLENGNKIFILKWKRIPRRLQLLKKGLFFNTVISMTLIIKVTTKYLVFGDLHLQKEEHTPKQRAVKGTNNALQREKL